MNSVNVVSFLLANHIVSPEEIVDSGITLVNDLRDRFAIQKVRIGKDSRVIVKQALSDDGLARLQQEIITFKFLSSRTETRHVSPDYYASDHQYGLLAMEFVGSGATLNDHAHLYNSHLLSGAGSARLLGTILGSLHRCTKGERPIGLSEDIPWILEVLAPNAPWQPASFKAVLSKTNDQLLLTHGLEAARGVWTRECVIHGDMKWDNCLVENKGNEFERIRFIDWELASFGDPAWDVAGILHEYLILSSYTVGEPRLRTQRDGDVIFYFESVRTLLHSFLKNYVLEVNVVFEHAKDSFIQRLVLFLGARFLQTSFEIAMINNLAGADFSTALNLAEAVFRDSAAVAHELSAVSRSE